jgi:hypothetical protein
VYTATYLVEKDGRPVKKFYDRWSAAHFIEENPGHDVTHAYIVTDPRKGTEVVYDPDFTMLFPRMYSNQQSHTSAYKDWSDFKGTPMRTTDREGKPTIIKTDHGGEHALLLPLPDGLDVLALLHVELRRTPERHPGPRQHHGRQLAERCQGHRCQRWAIRTSFLPA